MRKYRKPYKEHVYIQYAVKLVVDILVIACIAYFLAISFFDRMYIVGASMEEVLYNEQLVLINKAVYEISSPNRYDIIAFEASGANKGKRYIKRIIGLPGETIQIKNGKIYINDMVLIDDIIDTSIITPGMAHEPIVLGDDEYFVLGDNRNNSEDSRFYTISNVKRQNIIGKIWGRIYPVSDIGLIE